MKEEVINVDAVNVKKKSKIGFYCYLFIKRLFDIICSLIGCIFMLPITIIVKISYVLSGFSCV